MTQEELIIHLVNTNANDYNILKCCEEMAELNEKLLKYVTKWPGYKPKVEDIVEEIGDTLVRLKVVTAMLNVDKAVQDRIDYKCNRLIRYIETKEHKGEI
jgi:NTP pyrophosphatase (non-canonical NTP hydrolase)